MTQEKLSVRKIREILRLKHEAGLSNRAIARACSVSNSTVGDYVVRARRAGLGWPLPDELREEDLYRKLFPEVEKPRMEERPLPDGETVHRDLARKGVTLKLLWHIVPMSFGRSTGRNIQTGMDIPNFGSTTSAGTRRTQRACVCHTKAEKCWKWIMPG